MPRMTGGDAIVDSLLRHGIDTVFGLPGVQMYGLFDAFARNANRIRVINARHEQTTAYMALGYACATGRPAVYSVVPGPGMLNTTAALSTQRRNRCFDPAGSIDVIVLDQNAVRQIEAMIIATAHLHGVLFKNPHVRRRFSGIQQFGLFPDQMFH